MSDRDGAPLWPGIVTVSDWMMAPDGETYLSFWAPHWRVFDDKGAAANLGIGRLKSSDGWWVAGYNEHETEPVVVFPGCSVKGFTRSAVNPSKRAIYSAT